MEDWMPQEAHFDAVMKRVINVALVSSAAPWCGRIFFPWALIMCTSQMGKSLQSWGGRQLSAPKNRCLNIALGCSYDKALREAFVIMQHDQLKGWQAGTYCHLHEPTHTHRHAHKLSLTQQQSSHMLWNCPDSDRYPTQGFACLASLCRNCNKTCTFSLPCFHFRLLLFLLPLNMVWHQLMPCQK